MNGNILVIIFVGSMLIGLVASKGRNPLAVVGVGVCCALVLCIFWFLAIVCQDLIILHYWLQTVK
jgi:hypothetical protein